MESILLQLLLSVTLLLQSGLGQTARVSSLSPNSIGEGGGTITIHGSGFSEDVFNQFDPVLGNKVWFANEFVSVSCQTPVNWNFLLENPQDPSTTKITCDLPPRVGKKGSAYFRLILQVDGEDVPNWLSVRYTNWRTPRIKGITPRYGRVGDPVSIRGTIYTKEYGNSNFGDQGTVENRREESITAVMMGSRECALTDDLGNVFSITLNSPTSNDGQITCIPGGSYIGPYNATVFISGSYGKSLPHGDSYSVNSKNQLFMYHTLPEITSVSPNVGASSGSTQLKIRGKSFDAMPGSTKVMIGNTPCNIVRVDTEELVCSTPPEESVSSSSLGSRGLLYEIWTQTEAEISNVSLLSTSKSDYHSFVLDGSTVEGPFFNETNGFSARLSGYFEAPYTGNISFYLKSSDTAILYLSSSKDPANKTVLIKNDKSVNSANPGSPHSEPIMIVKDELYYMEVVHVQRKTSLEKNYLQVAFWEHETVYHQHQTKLARDEMQTLRMIYSRKFETQEIRFENISQDTEIYFAHQGLPSRSAVTLSNVGDFNATLMNMFTYTCEYLNTRHRYKQDFESNDYKLPGHWGHFQDNIEAYCGSKALQHSNRILRFDHGGRNYIDGKDTPWVCFAARGYRFEGAVQFLYDYIDVNSRKRRDWIKVPKVWKPSHDWSYQCLDMYAMAYNQTVTWTRPASNSYIRIKEIFLNTRDASGEIYMDEITISSSKVEIERKPPSLKSDDILVKEAFVVKPSTEDVFNLTINPWSCNGIEDDFELLAVKDANIEGLDVTGLSPEEKWTKEQEYLRTMDSVTFTSDSWGPGKITVTRKIRGTRALQGSFKLLYKDKEVELSPYPTDKSLEAALESAFGMTGVRTQYGNINCFDLYIHMYFDYSLGGNIEPIKMDSSNLQLNESGWRLFEVYTRQNGGIMVPSPGGDFFRLISEELSVNVFVGDFLSSCAAQDCSFTYDSSLNPTIDSVESSSSSGKTELNILGNGFSTVLEENIVKVGALDCVTLSASSTSIQCELEPGQVGTYDVSVIIANVGKAVGNVEYEIQLDIQSNHPTAGSLGGGTIVTVYGSGFPNSMDGWTNGTASIEGSVCKIQETSYTSFICKTSPKINGQRKKRAVSEISVSLNGMNISGGSFEYDSSLTPIVTKLSTNVASPMGGGELTITGSAFGAKYGTLKIGENYCKVLDWSLTEITCILPSNKHGVYPVEVSVPGNGFADIQSVDGISYVFQVTNMSPRKGSLFGGTEVKISGEGFSSCSDIEVSFGEEFHCPITSCTNTEITCITERKAKQHIITNSGRHLRYGPGYVWSNQHITISPGDTIDWRWNLQVSSSETQISIHQTSGPASHEYNGVGFKSQKGSKGRFVKKFMHTGIFYYSSEPIFLDDLFMKGVIRVVAAKEDIDSELKVTMKSTEAVQKISSEGSTWLPANDCAYTNDLSCSQDALISDTYIFRATECLSSNVTSIEIIEGSVTTNSLGLAVYDGAELKITGSSFSQNSCENKIYLGNSKCKVKSSSETELLCIIDGEDTSLPSLLNYDLEVNILNKGRALMNIQSDQDFSMKLMPRISSAEPSSGSWVGGNLFQIDGTGLLPSDGNDTVLVTFGEYPYAVGCKVVRITFSSISCVVPDFTEFKNSQSDLEVQVFVTFGYDSYETNMSLEYQYKDNLTPTLTSKSVSNVVSNSQIDVSGSGFADNFKVFVRDVQHKRFKRQARRIKRSVDEAMHVETTKQATWFDNVNWKCSKGSCSNDDVNGGYKNEKLNRQRRSLDEEQSFEFEHNDWILEICQNDENICSTMMDQSKKHVEKRSVEEELLEMNDGKMFEAEVISISNSTISFKFPDLPAGKYNVIIHNPEKGNALGDVGQITNDVVIDMITPSKGSLYGGQLIAVKGNGFCDNSDTSVLIGGAKCSITNISSSIISCLTPAGSEGDAVVIVRSCSLSATAQYNYNADTSPSIEEINPTTIVGAGTISIQGNNFGSDPKVYVGDDVCSINTKSENSISCNVNALASGKYETRVLNPDYGYSSSKEIESVLNITNVSPTTGSYGGGIILNIMGSGFDHITLPVVTVCNISCTIVSVSSTELSCLTPSNNSTADKTTCNIILTQKSVSIVSPETFVYDRRLTPFINELSPVRGGTGGGTQVTVTGTGFASEGNKVHIDGVECDISSESNTEIICFTNPHKGSIKTVVTVEVPGKGYAGFAHPDDATFFYIDRWSSKWTWGGLGTPLEGEYIVVTEGQTILLDISTPVLKFLLIKGGTLMFDEENPEIELNTEYILLVDGGKLEIGTEENPYESKAIITMHGNVRCTELPIFGCKVIGVRNGTLDFHGAYIPVTWTHLSETATAGSYELNLKQPVDWKKGDKIVIATTSDRSSMKENEEKVIDTVSSDGYTITLTEPLEYQHISIVQTFDGKDVESRAEVGLLSRNIIVRGTMNEQFKEVLPACEKEFNSGGAFSDAMQTCFAGKFGEELGHDEMGAIIIVSPKYKDQGLVTTRISYTEFSNVGQAFRVGRYPIHFHLTGNMNGSYVKGNAIHHSNNRACTLHDVSYLVVEHNVAYNIKGLSFFLEDGVEQYNVLQYNLAVFTRTSNSLLNPDINPASFWIVNPNNKFRHNACAGGTHFCFWLRPARVPDGPSYTRNFCPYKVPFDEFHNNTAHSMGWYGFWIFGQSNHVKYDPHSGSERRGYCNGHRIQTTIGSFTTWNNKRGFEIVSAHNIRLENQTHMDHDFAGFEIFTASGPYGDDGPGIFNSIIVGHSQISNLTAGKETACTPGGIHLTDSGYTIKNVKFFNFDRDCYAMSMRLEEEGATVSATRVENVEFFNSPNKVFLEKGEDQGLWLHDVDGSLTGAAESSLVGNSPTIPDSCVQDSSDDFGSVNLGGNEVSVCPSSVEFHRLLMKGESSPTALKYNAVNLKTDNGLSRRPWGDMLKGWQALISQSDVNWLSFDTNEHLANVSYKFEVSDMKKHVKGNYVLIGHEFYQEPDMFSILSNEFVDDTTSLTSYPTYTNNSNGDWYFKKDPTTNISKLVYMLSDQDHPARQKRSAEVGFWPSGGWINGEFKVYECYFGGCIPPPALVLPPGRPIGHVLWSNFSSWESFDSVMPVEGSTVIIPSGVWMVMDIDPPPLKRIYVYGGLEVMDNSDHTLEVEILMIIGGKFEVGTPKQAFKNNFELVLSGDHFTEELSLLYGPNVGAKALGVFGFLDMHGSDPGYTYVKIASNINIGDVTVELIESVAWNPGSEIVVTSTSYELKETEKRKIVSIAGKTLTVDKPFEFKHTAKYVDVDGISSAMLAAEVGLLTRNVKVVGKEYPKMHEDEFGGRIIVGSMEQDGATYAGFARFENVEFAAVGQDGFYDNYDPRYAVAFLNTGDSVDSNGEPNTDESYVKKCSFNYVFNSAIGLFGSNNILIQSNVIYRFINDGILDESKNNRIISNLISMGESVARNKLQASNPSFFACINIKRASTTSLSQNIMAGCAQAGLIDAGTSCDDTILMEGNEIHTTMHGVHLNSYGVTRPDSGCVKIENFLIWKSFDYGIYTKSESSVKISRMVEIDNGVGLLPYIYGPSADSHLFEEKYMDFYDSYIVAASENYDCNEEEKLLDIFSAKFENKRKWPGRGQKINGEKFHHVGVLWPIFQSSYGKDKLPWHKAVIGAEGTNPALRGILNMYNVTFSNFGSTCNGKDVIFRTNAGEDDMNWPISTNNIKLVNVVNENKIYIDEPLASKVQPADCTDFDCDGMKKALIYDKDGSLSGDSLTGTILPDSAFEWDGNPARGLGYFRVPKPMITNVDGTRIEYGDKMPNMGIYRDDSCAYNDNWRAYKCSGIQHRIMIIESMDRDSKIRRLSPLAVLANPGPDGFIDLVNGPQDHSCCAGYTCAERLSTLYTMVATGIEYEIMFSSIPPQNFRFHLLHNENGNAVRLKIWFPKQQRLDVYVDGNFITPNNIDNSKESYNLHAPNKSYIPELDERNGANYFDPTSGHLYLNLKGPATVDIKTQPVVVLKLGMTVPIENFFEENVIANIAGLLGIDKSNIRITNIVREGSVRKKRSAEEEVISSIQFEIGPPPLDNLENFVPEEHTYTTTSDDDVTENPIYTTTTTKASTTSWTPPENYLSFDKLQSIQANIANEFQTGKLNAALNLTLTGMEMEEPVAPPEKPKAYTSPEERAAVLPTTYAEQSVEKDNQLLETYEQVDFDVPHSLNLAKVPENVKEMKKIDPAPEIYISTEEGKMIKNLGDDSDPWQCTATLLSGPGGELMGTLSVPFVDGIANFDDLFISLAGTGYIVEFNVTYPSTSLSGVKTPSFDVGKRPLSLQFPQSIDLVPVGQPFAIQTTIWDEALDEAAASSVLSSYSWACSISLLAGSNTGLLSGNATKIIPSGENVALFEDLSIDQIGSGYRVEAECSSTDYDPDPLVEVSPPIEIHTYPETGMMKQTEIDFKFDGAYEKIADVIAAFKPVAMTCDNCPGQGTDKAIHLNSLKTVKYPIGV